MVQVINLWVFLIHFSHLKILLLQVYRVYTNTTDVLMTFTINLQYFQYIDDQFKYLGFVQINEVTNLWFFQCTFLI